MFFKLSVLALLATSIAAQGCAPACCDVLVTGDDTTIVGLNCVRGGIDCAFDGQMQACCQSINRFTKVGRGCERQTN